MDTLWRYVGIAICLIALVVVGQSRAIVAALPQVGAVIASVVVELTNGERAGAGLETLAVSDALTRVAEDKARDMAENGYFAHVSPEGLTPWYWFGKEGYAFIYAGENLAIDFDSSPAVVEAWMNSPTHRANIVGSQFTEIGVAVATGTYDGRDVTFVVQEFGTPRPDVAQSATAATPVRENAPESARAPAVATTLAGEAPTDVEVLGQAAGAVIETSTEVPWWYRMLHYFF